MKLIQRDLYLNQLISRKENGLIKTITGLRRSGKSYLLFKIFHNHLHECGVKEENIITLALDDDLIVNIVTLINYLNFYILK